jgi:hypothetical protein
MNSKLQAQLEVQNNKLEEQQKRIAQVIFNITPWIAASLKENSCEEYTEAATALIGLDFELNSEYWDGIIHTQTQPVVGDSAQRIISAMKSGGSVSNQEAKDTAKRIATRHQDKREPEIVTDITVIEPPNANTYHLISNVSNRWVHSQCKRTFPKNYISYYLDSSITRTVCPSCEKRNS